ncbi:MAG: hypothetical protein G3M70_06235 [Candidatus Nitronauta litoralis]|uniref:Curlin associated repeat-containing protein n=1 Tax=Candidatus Nitronauta litoralis TaxID=2705533 RepID=A0A7T0BW22_9BACT|nr:MAG: hypothetical protein G3M70_06235 [Candidatus Nitronauta litoralis]
MSQLFLKACFSAALIGFFSTPAVADNIADSRTTGDGNLSTIDQAGDDVTGASEALIVQSGDRNSSEVGQGKSTGIRQHGPRSANVAQTGDDNQSRVEQNGPNNTADVEQTGAGNESDVQQGSVDLADDNEANVVQMGDGNLSTVVQAEGIPTGRRQHGFRQVTVFQDGIDNVSMVVQQGPNNSASVEQFGELNESEIFQDGGDGTSQNTATVFQSGRGNRSRIDQAGKPTGKR